MKPETNIPSENAQKQQVDVNVKAIIVLTEILKGVDFNAPEAALNVTTISDGNGGRIFL